MFRIRRFERKIQCVIEGGRKEGEIYVEFYRILGFHGASRLYKETYPSLDVAPIEVREYVQDSKNRTRDQKKKTYRSHARTGGME
jgi:hypothetical protein